MRDLLARLGLTADNPGVWSGAWSSAAGAPSLPSYDPASGAEIARVRAATDADYEATVQRAVTVSNGWRQIPAPQRGEAVRLLANALRENKDALGSLVAREMGKIKVEGDGEVQEMIDIADFAVGQARMLYGKSMHSERPQHRMFEQWHPLGVVGVISAFNFPVAVWAWNACIAAICGNVTLWRPSPHAALCAVAVQRICNDALAAGGFPPVFMLCVDDGVRLAERMAEDRRIALLSFTGSTAVGRTINQTVAGRLGRCLLELGGNNALIVDAAADLDLVTRATVFGAVGTAGQRCTSTRRLIVHADVEAALVARLAQAYAQVSIGDPLEAGTLMGPLISEDAVGRYFAAIEAARSQGGAVVVGGKRVDRPGNFVEPTIIRVPADAAIVRTETFAPILFVTRFTELDEAIAQQNSVSHGLSSAIFTQDLRRAEAFLSATGSDCGIANVNIGTSGAEIGGAFGGEKDSGGGREAGSDAWKQYMRRQTCTVNWGRTLPLAQGIEFA